MNKYKHWIDVPVPEPPAWYAAKFWRKVDSSAGPDACWPWLGKDSTGQGYGRCYLVHRKVIAHRIAFYLATGINPTGKMVCHHCDNPSCCNPRHMFLGTAADNYNDANGKGRIVKPSGEANGMRKWKGTDRVKWRSTHRKRLEPSLSARGERQGSSKLTDKLVLLVRKWHAKGSPVSSIAQIMGVHSSTVYRIVKGLGWKHVQWNELAASWDED